jgi:hypothetical protein
MLDSKFPPRQNDAVDGWEECPTVGHWNCRTDRLNGRVGRSGRVDKKGNWALFRSGIYVLIYDSAGVGEEGGGEVWCLVYFRAILNIW